MSGIVLNGLLDKAATDSKKALSKEEQRKYRDALGEMLKNNGLNDETIHYLVEGIKYGSVGSYIIWARTIDEKEQNDAIILLMSHRKVKNLDNVNRLKMTLWLLAGVLNEQKENEVVVTELMQWLVELSYKKDGKRLQDLSKIFKLTFMANMKNGMTLPSLSKLPFSTEYKKALYEMFNEAILGLEPKGDEEIDKARNLREWIKNNAVLEETNKSVEETPTEKKEGEEKSEKKESGEVVSEFKGQFSKRLFELAKVVETLEQELSLAREKNKDKDKEIARLKVNYAGLQKSYTESVEENTKLRTTIEETSALNIELEKKATELQDRVERQVSVIDVYDQDKANSKTEILNQIATSLKKIYADFKTAETMEMTIDLGENMRDSLDDVFRKLKKHGIDIEGR